MSVDAPATFPAPFGRYLLLKQLGKGGMGAVYLAHDPHLDRQVALKLPTLKADDSARALERFQREARAAATIVHPNVCPLYEVGELGGLPYLTMAYIEGEPLTSLIGPGAVTPRRGVDLVRKLALALHEAHQQGIIHRDLKPANVMIDKRGEPVILDFGIACRLRSSEPRLTLDGHLVGTPAYMPPEQVGGEANATGPAGDIYSLGVILYELLAGRPPFLGDSLAVLSHVLHDEPPRPSVFHPGLDKAVETICLKAMARKAEDRYPSMADLAAAAESYLSRQPREEEQPSPPADATMSLAPKIRTRPAEGQRSTAPVPGLPEQPTAPGPTPARLLSRWAWGVGGAALVLLGALAYLTSSAPARIEPGGQPGVAEGPSPILPPEKQASPPPVPPPEKQAGPPPVPPPEKRAGPPAARAGLAAPRQLSPEDGSIFNQFPRQTRLTWEAVPGAVSYVLETQHQFKGNWFSSTIAPLVEVRSTAHEHDHPGAQPGRWRVWAVGEGGQEGAKSEWRTFRFTK